MMRDGCGGCGHCVHAVDDTEDCFYYCEPCLQKLVADSRACEAHIALCDSEAGIPKHIMQRSLIPRGEG